MKKSVLVLAAVLCVSCAAGAQTAKVVQLSEKDAAQIKALYQEKAAIEEKISTFREHVIEVYLTDPIPKDGCNVSIVVPHPFSGPIFNFSDGSKRCIKDGWDATFIYSEDFRFVVPASLSQTSVMSPYNGALYQSVP